MYYNTNNEEGESLVGSWTATAKQDALILSIFMATPNSSFTPDEIDDRCRLLSREWPITSIRRAINTLTKHGNLTKTSELRKGKYGKNTHTWQFATQVSYNPDVTSID